MSSIVLKMIGLITLCSWVSMSWALNEDLTTIAQCYQQARTAIAQQSCGEAEYAYYDRLLNQRYTTLLSLLNSVEKPLLVNAEQSWLTYQQKECLFNGLQVKNSSIEPLISIKCYVNLNKKRIIELENHINFYSGRHE